MPSPTIRTRYGRANAKLLELFAGTGGIINLHTFPDLAASLAANGYAPLPLLPRSKRPALDEWTSYVYRAGDERRFVSCGVGLLAGALVPIDIDVRDAVLARTIEQLALETFGAAPRRVGNAPKVMLFYRTAQPFRKMRSVAVRMRTDAVGDKPHLVEVLGVGQQCAVYGIHPDTGKPFEWNGAGDPLEVALDQLEPVAEAELTNFLARVSTLLLEHGDPVGRLAEAQAERTSNDELEAFNAQECREAIAAIANDDLAYDDWITFGYAIKGALGEGGRDAWHTFSARSAKYDERVTERAWRAMAPSRIGAGTLYRAAFDAGWDRPSHQVDVSGLLGRKGDSKAPAVHVPVDWADVALNPPPAREWAIDGWLGVGFMTLLAGRGGIGKTLLMQQLGSALSLGKPMLGAIDAPRKVLMWCAEDDSDELKRRQVAIADWLGSPVGLFNHHLIVQPLAGIDCALAELSNGVLRLTRNMKLLWEQINDYRVGAFMLDNIAHLFGGNENDRFQVTQFTTALTGMCIRARVTGVLAGHPAKSTDSEFSGSTAWENAMRGRLYLSRSPPDTDDKDADPSGLTRYISKRKANYSALDCQRLTYHNGVLQPEEALPGDGLIKNLRDKKARDVVLNGLRRLKEMGVFGNASHSTANYLPKLIASYKLSEGLHRKELETGLRDLMSAGAVRVGSVGRYANRVERLGLVEK